MTVCNMSIEAGARAGMVGPDDTTFAYLEGRPHAPHGAAWDAAVARWRALRDRRGRCLRSHLSLRRDGLEPMITYGTNPAMAMSVRGHVPHDGTAAVRARARSTWA